MFGLLSFLGFITAQDAIEPEEEVTLATPGGGYAPWEYERLNKVREAADRERADNDNATLIELSEAYDRINGLIDEVEEVKAEVSQRIPRAAPIPEPVSVIDNQIDMDDIISRLTHIQQRIERAMAEDEEEVALLLMGI